MQKLQKLQRMKAGQLPGSLVHVGQKKSDTTVIRQIIYSTENFSEESIGVQSLCRRGTTEPGVQWIDVDSIHDVAVLEKIGGCFGLHPLVMEDILNTGQRPKIEYYDEYVYIVIKILYYDRQTGEFASEQESLILGCNYVLSFGERDNDVFNTVVERLRRNLGQIRKLGADYLLYSLLDLAVDNYFVVLEDLGEGIETAEDELVSNPTAGTLQEIHVLKRQMLYLHKAVWPFREIVGSLERGDIPWMKESTEVYLRDLYDHVIQVMDNADTQRDILSSMLDIYLSSVSNRMNGIMKVLTIISTVFMPLTFLVGVYGMNLVIPEARMPWFYPVLWVAMAGIAVTMMAFFKRKKWW
jgi:magnesium transporter